MYRLKPAAVIDGVIGKETLKQALQKSLMHWQKNIERLSQWSNEDWRQWQMMSMYTRKTLIGHNNRPDITDKSCALCRYQHENQQQSFESGFISDCEGCPLDDDLEMSDCCEQWGMVYHVYLAEPEKFTRDNCIGVFADMVHRLQMEVENAEVN